jgi:hypothetical protein
MNSQFSDVRFSSVALAVQRSAGLELHEQGRKEHTDGIIKGVLLSAKHAR